MVRRDDRTLGVYVHVPFCERVCPYCDFAVVAARPLARDAERRYVDALLAELAARAPESAGRSLASLYLGGGTPSLLHPESVARLVEAVRAAFPPTASAGPVETTLEVNPSTVERARLPGFRDAGVSRVSVGVQSFDDLVLRRLGRAHRADEARRTLAACREAGFADVSLDLLTAAPGQSRASLARDLGETAAFAPEHVSAYELTLEPGTPFAAARERLPLPDEDEAAGLSALAEERLEVAGLARYEVSSYARPGREAVHNRRYWERRPVLGLGMGAHTSEPAGPGRPHGARRANVRDLGSYLARIEAARPADAGPPDVPDAVTARGEAAFLALRTRAGLDAARFAREFGAPPRAFFGDAVEALVAEGLLRELPSGDLRPTRRGLRFADEVALRFVAAGGPVGLTPSGVAGISPWNP